MMDTSAVSEMCHDCGKLIHGARIYTQDESVFHPDCYPHGSVEDRDEITRLRAEVERLREALIGLFSALDDCDTADDIAKSDDAAFRRLVRKAHAKRWAYATTDGYTVTPLHHPRQDAEGK